MKVSKEMTVKKLITQLLECKLDANVELLTINKDSNGRRHIYELSGIDYNPVFDSEECVNVQYLLFKDWRYESEE